MARALGFKTASVKIRFAAMWAWIGKWLKRLFLGSIALVAAWCVAGIAMAAGDWGDPPRGVMVDVDGRKQRIVCEGDAKPGVPTVVFESGIYSGSADWGFIQPEVAKGGRTCSYDRAGMGWSQPSTNPRDSGSMARELHQLLRAAGEPGPYVLVGHSMAGLLTRAYLSQNPTQVVGLVLIDAVDPSARTFASAEVWIKRASSFARFGANVAPLGVVKPLSLFYANGIGQSGIPLKEKRRMFGAPSHMRASAAEIDAILQGGEAALAAEPYLAALPIATITAGRVREGMSEWKESQARAARISTRGTAVNVDAASHTSILGPIHGGVVIAAIERVRRDAMADMAAKIATAP
jgi:pimeloyl-ACP methyl ester carboxylesterase